MDPSFYWRKAKTSIISLVKKREKDLNKLENERVKLLMGFYFSVLNDIQEGADCLEELNEIKFELNKIYDERSKKKVDKMRGTQIDDPFYDIHKLQN